MNIAHSEMETISLNYISTKSIESMQILHVMPNIESFLFHYSWLFINPITVG